MQVLIVEEDPSTANALYLTLMWEGYSPQIWDIRKPSKTLEDAIKKGQYDIAVLDSHLDLPGGPVDIKSRTCHTRVVLTTTDSKRREQLQTAYAPSEILIKPFSLEELMSAIRPS
jgi:DNA-binding response OmpR family regulator